MRFVDEILARIYMGMWMWMFRMDKSWKIATERIMLAAIFMSISAAIQGSTDCFIQTTDAFLHSNWMVKAATAARRFVFPRSVQYGTNTLHLCVQCVYRHFVSVGFEFFVFNEPKSLEATPLCVSVCIQSTMHCCTRAHSFSNVDSTIHWIPVRICYQQAKIVILWIQTDGVVFIAIAVVAFPYMPACHPNLDWICARTGN